MLVGTGILLGYALLLRRAKKLGLDDSRAARLALCVVVSGFLCAHFFKILYSEDPWGLIVRARPLEALAIFSGSASFGGLFGALAGGWLYLRRQGLSAAETMRYFDLLAFVFPVGLMAGRFGCYLAHDHPGVRTASWLGVRYPDGVRFDLGLLEALFLLLLIAAFLLLDRAKRPDGFYVSLFLICYGVFRWGLDGLHVDTVRYFGVSVDRWSACAAVAVGVLPARRWTRVSEEVQCERSCFPA